MENLFNEDFKKIMDPYQKRKVIIEEISNSITSLRISSNDNLFELYLKFIKKLDESYNYNSKKKNYNFEEITYLYLLGTFIFHSSQLVFKFEEKKYIPDFLKIVNHKTYSRNMLLHTETLDNLSTPEIRKFISNSDKETKILYKRLMMEYRME
jgi:hypothetical protein